MAESAVPMPTGGEEMTYAKATAGQTPVLEQKLSSRAELGALQPREMVPFFSGIPAVECIKGVLHLYRHQ